MASASGTSFSTASISCSFKQRLAHTRTSNLSSVSPIVKGISYPSLRLKQGHFRFQVSCAAKPETVEKVCTIVKKQLALPDGSTVSGESKFTALGADSLDTVEIVMGLEEEFGISVEEESAQAITTVQEAADLIEELIENRDA